MEYQVIIWNRFRTNTFNTTDPRKAVEYIGMFAGLNDKVKLSVPELLGY